MSESPAAPPLGRRWQFGLKHAFLLLTLCGGWFALASADGVPIWLVAAVILSWGAFPVFLAMPGAAFAILGTRRGRPLLAGAGGCALVCVAYALFFHVGDPGTPPL